MLKNGEADRRRTPSQEGLIVAQAARALGSLIKDRINGRRRNRRKWTGMIGRRRTWVGQKVEMPNGSVAWVVKIQRGLAVLRTAELHDDGHALHKYVPTASLKLWKNPDAVLMGRRKEGKIERRSEKKSATARLNGLRPTRLGRRRGRPRKTAQNLARSPESTLSNFPHSSKKWH